MKKLLSALGAVLFLCSSPSFAFDKTGNQLYESFKSVHRFEEKRTVGGDNIEMANVLGYVGGVFDYGILAGRFCPPANVSLVQVISIVEKALNESPETRNLDAAFLIDQAVVRSFPCNK